MYIPVIAICHYHGRVGTDLSVLWVAYWSVFCFDVVADVCMVSMAY
jgi:hypothetical protein